MFTGLVQAIGSVQRAGSSLLITWQPGQGLEAALQLGDSVAAARPGAGGGAAAGR